MLTYAGADILQANTALCSYLLCWLWLLQATLGHAGALAMVLSLLALLVQKYKY
jgi:hypothetical protein